MAFVLASCFLLYCLAADTHRDAVQTLYGWCTEDPLCEASYHLSGFKDDEEKRMQVFAFFFSTWVRDFDHVIVDMDSYIEEKFGSRGDDENSLRLHWLYHMRLMAHEKELVKCGVNEKFMFSRETMDAYCACINNRNCDDGGNWRNRGEYTIVLVFLLGIRTIVGIFYYSAETLHYYAKAKKVKV